VVRGDYLWRYRLQSAKKEPSSGSRWLAKRMSYDPVRLHRKAFLGVLTAGRNLTEELHFYQL
jgi:hypothetical protein